MMNDFFDCTNVRSLHEHERKRNYLIKPYTTVDDDRFGWLRDVFLKYLENWKRSTLERDGQYSADDRGKMFLSSQTYEDLQISVHCHIEAIQFLLQQGFQYVLSERFMQDVLEDYFGHQRAKVVFIGDETLSESPCFELVCFVRPPFNLHILLHFKQGNTFVPSISVIESPNSFWTSW